MKVLITGGAGYVGCQLVPALLGDGHDVIVYDTFWFGDHLPGPGRYYEMVHNASGARLIKVREDIRDLGAFRGALTLGHVDAVIHMACLSNDPSSEIDADLTRGINLDAFEPLVVAARQAGVRRFIYCSTSSVYGVSDAPEVREDHPHVPITLYNTYKSQCEPLLMRHASPDFECVILRPSTVCGYSPRQRLDLAVNILTSLAYHTGKIIVHGGAQRRPNIHIQDLVDCYLVLLAAPAEKVAGQVFNVGAGNVTILDLATLVREEVEEHRGVPIDIDVRPIEDVRSYQVCSAKIEARLGFSARRPIASAVRDLCCAFDAGLVPGAMEDDRYYNVRTMRRVFSDLYGSAGPSNFRPEDGILSEIDMRRGAGR